MKERLGLAQYLVIRAIILEVDAKIVLESFKHSSINLSHKGIILTEAYSIASNFRFFKTQFVPRYYNLVANKLANLARVRDNQVWTSKAPSCILDVLALEVVGL